MAIYSMYAIIYFRKSTFVDDVNLILNIVSHIVKIYFTKLRK